MDFNPKIGKITRSLEFSKSYWSTEKNFQICSTFFHVKKTIVHRTILGTKMARITVEDCLDNVDNRFELVMVSSKRARQIRAQGKDPLVEADNDKPTVIALREIADGLVNADILNEKPSVEIEEITGSSLEETQTIEQQEELQKPKP